MKALGAAFVLAALAGCAAPEPPPADTGGPKIGVVVLHEEGGDPYGRTLRFTRTLIRDGFLTDSPEMPWSARRAREAGVGTMKEIDASVARLKSRGAQKIFVAGYSQGAAAAVGYAKDRRMDGLIALAPAGAMNAAAVRPGTPVLWILGDTEYASVRKAEQAAFEALPRNPPPRLVEIAAGHADTPDAAGAVCAKWMKEIAAATRPKEGT